jgi:AGCS family alanine or glycine:cation symporter
MRLTDVLQMLHQAVWGPWTLALFLGTGLWFSVKMQFFQITGLPVWWRATIGSLWKGSGEPEMHPKITAFQSACTALAATVGTGNIAGVATALTAGGPGAVFWMWVSALLGMMTAYAETYLGQIFRQRKADGRWICGPMIYMEQGLKLPGMAVLYAALAVLASLGMGSMVQANAVSSTVQYHFRMAGWQCGLLLVIGAGWMIVGGISRIARVSETVMPIASGIYVIFSLFTILTGLEFVPQVLQTILREALRPRAAAGGISGFFLSAGMRYGLARGTFSNEAGLGSLAVLHGSAENTTPEQQGMWAMFAVFLDTIVICSLTAFVILCVAARWKIPAGLDGAALTAWCFSRRLGNFGSLLVSGSMAVFAFETIVAWYYVGEQMVEYLEEKISGGARTAENSSIQDETRTPGDAPSISGYGTRGVRGSFRICYVSMYLAAVYLGCVSRPSAVWLASDIANGLMAFPNLLAIVLLSKYVRKP